MLKICFSIGLKNLYLQSNTTPKTVKSRLEVGSDITESVYLRSFLALGNFATCYLSQE